MFFNWTLLVLKSAMKKSLKRNFSAFEIPSISFGWVQQPYVKNSAVYLKLLQRKHKNAEKILIHFKITENKFQTFGPSIISDQLKKKSNRTSAKH